MPAEAGISPNKTPPEALSRLGGGSAEERMGLTSLVLVWLATHDDPKIVIAKKALQTWQWEGSG
jgi:hypothetical protein